MANGEWLTQLMAGLGGAFTGATAAKERMALEAERKRKMEEALRQRELAQGLFRGQPTMPQIGEYLGSGGDVTTASLAARLGAPDEPKTPNYRQVIGAGGEVYEYPEGGAGPTRRVMGPTGEPLRSRTAAQPGTERPLTPSQRGVGRTFLQQYLSDESLRTNAQEATDRVRLVESLRINNPGAGDDEIGYMLMTRFPALARAGAPPTRGGRAEAQKPNMFLQNRNRP